MSIFSKIKSLLGFDKKEAAAAAAADKLILSIKNLINREDLVADALKRYQQISALPATEREAEYIKVYFVLEEFVTKNKPLTVKREFTHDSLREDIRHSINIEELGKNLRLIFLPPAEQDVSLLEIGLVPLVDYALKIIDAPRFKSTIAKVTKGTVLEGVDIDGVDLLNFIRSKRPGAARSEIASVIKTLFSVLYQFLSAAAGSRAVQEKLEAAFGFVKKTYPQDFTARFLNVMPEGILEYERLAYLSKEQLKEKVLERTEELEEAKAKDEALLRSIGDGVVAVDQEGKVILINTSAQEMLGWKAEEVLGKNWFEILRVEDEKGNLIPKEERPFYLALSAGTTTTTTTTTTTYYYVRKDGTRFPVAITATPVRNEKIEGAIAVFRDITQEKEIDRAKSEFVAITAHELRTPLTIIFGSAERILKLLSKRTIDNDIAEMIVDIRDEGSRLLKIVNDFLDIIVLEQKVVSFKNKKIDLGALIREVQEQFEAKAQENKLSLAFTPPPSLPLVLADRERVRQVLENLIGNAIQYTKEGGIIITLERSGSFVKIAVTDTGMGIPPERQKSLFQKFQTIGERFLRSKEYGSGMGLYISTMLVESMGGVIRLEKSEIGRGSTFSFTLPIAS